MKTMILDTSTRFLYVSFVDGDKEIFKEVKNAKNSHSENLLNIIKKGLDLLNLQVKDFDKIIIGIGPGSYTGLRVSTTIGKMFSFALNIPLYLVSSLDILGSGYYLSDGKYAITSVAKKDYLYTRVVEVKNGKYELLEDDNFVLEEDFKKQYNDATLITEECYLFDCFEIIKLAKTKVEDIHNLVPNYLRKANT